MAILTLSDAVNTTLSAPVVAVPSEGTSIFSIGARVVEEMFWILKGPACAPLSQRQKLSCRESISL